MEPIISPGELTLTADSQVAYASGRVRDYCHWHVYPAVDDTITVDAEGGSLLLLPSLKVNSVTSVVEVGADGTETTLVFRDDYSWSPKGILARVGRWPCRFQSVRVEMNHGYDELPDALAEVVVSVAKRMPAQQATVTQRMVGSEQVMYGSPLSPIAATGFTAAEQMVLDGYRIKARP